MTKRRAWLLAWVVMTLLVIVAFRGIAWEQAVAAVRQADPGWFLLAVIANFAILPLSAWQWMWFLPRAVSVKFGNMFWITAVTSTVSNGGPFLAGHAAGLHLLATRGGTGYATATSVKALDQLTEGLAKLALVGAVLLVAPLPARLRAAAFTLAVVVPVFGLVLLVSVHRAHVLDRLAERTHGWRRATLAFLGEAAVQLETMRQPFSFAVAVLLGLAQKLVAGLAIIAVLAALGIQLPAWAVLLSLTAVDLSTMASVTPANVGIYEATAVLAYRAVGVPLEAALGLAILQHLAYLVPMAGVGWLVLAISGLRPGEVMGEAAGPPAGLPASDS